MEREVDEHFIELRGRINARLLEIQSPVSHKQANEYSWLYGALGAVPASTMFICETPSLSPIRRDLRRGEDGGPTGIERQWWGGERNPAAKRFRAALYEMNLKTTPPRSSGGWQCYITNVIKEANIARDQKARGAGDRLVQARQWADILTWELEKVKPRRVIAVGGATESLLRSLQIESRLPRFDIYRVCHYSARGTNEAVKQDMIDGIGRAIR